MYTCFEFEANDGKAKPYQPEQFLHKQHFHTKQNGSIVTHPTMESNKALHDDNISILHQYNCK